MAFFDADPVMSSADADSIVALFLNHKYAALVAILANLAVRLLKDDTILPTIPKRWRALSLPLFALLAIAGDRLATHHSWTEAILDGVVGVLMAMYFHEAVSQRIFPNGELPLPEALLKRECRKDSTPSAAPNGSAGPPVDSPAPPRGLQDSAALHRERRDLPTEPPPPPPSAAA